MGCLTGSSLYPAIVWSDLRATRDLVTSLNMSSRSSVVQARSGIPIATYFSAVKLRWLLVDSQDNVAAAHYECRLLAGEAPALQVLPTDPMLQAQWTPG